MSVVLVPLGVRFFCALNRRLLPTELVAAHGRDIDEAFLDLYREATVSSSLLARLRLLGRELRNLLATGYSERRALRRERRHLPSLRAKSRTSPFTTRN